MSVLAVVALAFAAAAAPAFASSPLHRYLLASEPDMPGARITNPDFCRGLDCPPFTVKQQLDGVEQRSYEEGNWVSTDISNLSYSEAMRTGFMRLFNYISGANEAGMKIDMTAPVRTTVKPGPGPLCQEFTISFYLPTKFQKGGMQAPKPTADGVYLQTVSAFEVYVGVYGGFSSESKIIDEAQAIISKVESAGLKHDASLYYAAGYDAPFRLTDRHNEVWVPVA